VSSRTASESLEARSSQADCVLFPFVAGMNHEVRTRRQLCLLLPMRQCERGRQPVDEALAGEGRR